MGCGRPATTARILAGRGNRHCPLTISGRAETRRGEGGNCYGSEGGGLLACSRSLPPDNCYDHVVVALLDLIYPAGPARV